MQCTVQEIEEKRRQALEKLSKRSLISSINKASSNLANFGSDSSTSNSPKPRIPYESSSPKQFPQKAFMFRNGSDNATSSKVPTPNKPFSYHNGAKSPRPFNNGTISKPYDKPRSAVNFYGKGNVITGTCSLISEDRFVVELSGFSAVAIDVFKTIPSKSYNPKTRFWDFHLNDYELLHSKLAYLQPDVVVGRLPTFVLNCCKTPKQDSLNVDVSGIDQELWRALMPFQKEGVLFGIAKNGRCLIADDMGLGKTMQALAIASYYQNDWPMLISTTSSMKNVWEETVHKHMPSISLMHTQHMVAASDYIGDAKILIVSREMVWRSIDKLMERKFGILIVDESHNFKSYKAKCTKAVTDLAKRARRVILLSGTPAMSRPNELYTQLSLIDDKFFGNFFEYSKRYCDGKMKDTHWDATGESNLQELQIILAKRFMIRRTKEEVLKSLPQKQQSVVTLDVHLDQFSEEDRNSLNALANHYNRQKKHSEKHAALLTFFAETAKIKIPSVCSYILQTLEHTQKFIVFAHHQKMLDAIGQVLDKKKKKFIRIDGSTSSEQRKFFIDKFQLDDNYVCAILSITAANAGITLTAAKLVLFAELHWNPSIISQAESRAHRIGQEGTVRVQYLIAPRTADDSIWPLLQNKQKILKEAGLFKDSFDNVAITKQDLSSKLPIAECLQSDKPPSGFLDITNFFKSPIECIVDKENDVVKDLNVKNQFFDDDDDDMDAAISALDCMSQFDVSNGLHKENTCVNSVGENSVDVSSAEMEFLDNDVDEMLSNVELNL